MAGSATAEAQANSKEAHDYWGFLINPDKTAADKLDRLLRGIAHCITETYNPNDTHDVHPFQLASFYRAVGGDYDVVFLDMPASAIAFIWKSLGCLHSLQPDYAQDGFSEPTIPALKPRGFVLWQTIQLLLGPEEHVPFLQNALQLFNVVDPVDGKPFPKNLPTTCFPNKPDPDMTKWYEDMTERLRQECEVPVDPESNRPSYRYSSDTERHSDERRTAAQYFSNPLYRNPEGRPAVVRRHHNNSPRTPVGTLQAGGKVVVKTVRQIWNPHLWSGGGRRDGHHDHQDRRTSSGDITTIDHLRPPPLKVSKGEYTSTSSESDESSRRRQRRSPGAIRHHKSYSSPPREHFPPYSNEGGGRRSSAAHIYHTSSEPHRPHAKPLHSRSLHPQSRSPSRRPPPPQHHTPHTHAHELSPMKTSTSPYDSDHRPASAFGPSESPLFATRISQMQQPRPEVAYSQQYMQQQHREARPRPSMPHRYSHAQSRSMVPSLDSNSSLGSIKEAHRKASEHLAEVFSEDTELRELYPEALAKFGRKRFARNHDRLLKKFFKDLRSETQNNLQIQTIRALRNRSQRGQMTELICKLLDPVNPAKLQAMQVLLDGKPDHQHVLNRFLQPQTSELQAPEQSTTEVDEKSDSSEITDAAEDDNSSEEELENEDFRQLEIPVAFLMQGVSFDQFKASLRRFVRPPTTLQAALECRDPKVVRKMLLKQFDLIAKGEYTWLRELDEVGYTCDEIVELLLEEVNDSPWIYFEPREFRHAKTNPDIHIPGCVHRGSLTDSSPSSRSVVLSGTSGVTGERDIGRSVQELCGLAGIAPISRNEKKWNGNVRFEEHNSMAIVSYASTEAKNNTDYPATVSRITKALEGFCMAAGQVQSAGLCCNSFTILRHTTKGLVSEGVRPVRTELWRMEFKVAEQLLAEIKRLAKSDPITPSEAMNSHTVATQVLEALLPRTEIDSHGDSIDHILHLCSLAVQFLCLGFLSYTQAHIGALQPFFLDTPQRKVLLLGSQMSQDYEQIIAELVDLTCIGDMIQGPVLAFSTVQTQKESTSQEDGLRYDLLTSAEDILDTWGPGHFITRKGYIENPCAISIGGGIICATDKGSNTFHWCQSIGLDGPFPATFDPSTKIIIGTLVTVNESCFIDERKCWLNSSTALEHLGTYGPYWDPNERQSGIQAGQYVLAQFNQTWCKVPGKTLKRFQLEQEDDFLIPFLEYTWGLQVSFCTSVARRVPLRELVADVLPVFANTLLCEPHMWEELRTKYNIIGAFQGNDLRNWLNKLAPEIQAFVLKLIRCILAILQHTGVDREGKYLTIAWPQDGDVQRGFKIPCEKQSFWARMLADSEDCATFAYISPKCLESENVKCSGPFPVWRNSSTLLETAVIRHQPMPTTNSWALEHKRLYFIRKMDSLFLVKVHKPDKMSCAQLIASQSTMPRRFQQRLFMREEWKRDCRLRERQAVHESAERVVVLAMKPF